MTKEVPQPSSGFEFSEHEKLYDRISDARFMEMIRDERTTIHDVTTSSNNYGEFVFITASRPNASKLDCVTFFGLGYHERRERWITDTWSWYDAHQTEERLAITVDRQEVEALIQARRDEIAEDMKHFPSEQSQSGILYEFLADLTDEDGAATELDDLFDAGFLDEQ
ncbi:MAG: hypothetical protein KF716_20050 [Anaerolineae bacterium]|nr:hypothetical protein [Anaerolineae bacterium]